MQNRWNIALALAAGLTGGMLTHFVAPPTVSAQNPQVAQEIRAKRFVLVDDLNRNLGTFSAEPGSPQLRANRPGKQPLFLPGKTRIILRDAEGHELWAAGEDAQIRPLQASR